MNAASKLDFTAGEDAATSRWLVSAMIVIAAHAGFLLLLAHKRDLSAAGAPPVAVLIDLPALDNAPALEVPRDAVEEPKMIEAAPPKAESREAVAVPELPPAQKPAAVLVPPPQHKIKPKKKEISQPAATQKHEPPAPHTSAPKHPQAARGGASSAIERRGTAGTAAADASWGAEVRAHLVRYKPAGIEAKGVAKIAFSLARSGALLGARLAASSGSSTLDQWALEWVRRANPFPAAPSAAAGGPLSVTVPLRSR